VKRLGLATAAAIVGASIASLVPSTSAMGAPRDGGTPAPAGVPTTPVHHFVTMLQENHSFDNYFGTYPGADGLPAGTCVPAGDPAVTPPSQCVKPYLLNGKSSPRLASTKVAFDQASDNGKLDGFVSAQSGNGHIEDGAMGYYDGNELPFYWHLANRYVLFDHLFSSSSGGTLWNHLYWMTGSDGGLTDERIPDQGVSTPSIFDRLQAAGVTWKIYIENYDGAVNIDDPAALRRIQMARAPVLANPGFVKEFVDNPAMKGHVADLSHYYDDLAKGQLPAVSYIVPSGSSEHPPSKLHSGPLLVNRLIGALERSSAWPQSAFLLSYDDAGGFYDHVVPPTAGGSSLGFRVPALLVSPFAPVGKVNHTTLETASIPGFIEDNWNLAPLTTRDASAGRLTTAFDFKQPPRRAETVPFTRITAPLSLPGRGSVFPLYGGAAALAGLVIAGAVVLEVRHRAGTTDGEDPEPDPVGATAPDGPAEANAEADVEPEVEVEPEPEPEVEAQPAVVAEAAEPDEVDVAEPAPVETPEPEPVEAAEPEVVEAEIAEAEIAEAETAEAETEPEPEPEVVEAEVAEAEPVEAEIAEPEPVEAEVVEPETEPETEPEVGPGMSEAPEPAPGATPTRPSTTKTRKKKLKYAGQVT
jgi:phospholipase C